DQIRQKEQERDVEADGNSPYAKDRPASFEHRGLRSAASMGGVGETSSSKRRSGSAEGLEFAPLRPVHPHLGLGAEQGELSAGGIDVVTATAADEAGIARVDENLLERFDALPIRRAERGGADGIHRD